MVYGDLVALQHTGKDLSPQRQAICTVQTTAIVLFQVGDNLSCLIVNGCKTGMLPQRKSVHLNCHYTEPVLQKADQRKEYLIGDSQSGDKHQRRSSISPKNLEIHYEYLFTVLNLRQFPGFAICLAKIGVGLGVVEGPAVPGKLLSGTVGYIA